MEFNPPLWPLFVIVVLAFALAFGVGYSCRGCDSGPRVHFEWRRGK